MTRTRGTIVLSLICWAAGILCALSFNVFKGQIDFFDLFDKISSSILMPLGGILIAMFMGWKVPKSEISRILNNNKIAVAYFMISTRFVAPVGVLIVMIFGVKHWIQG
jgi:NSS family neurotransmitter:Na+ symporter